MPEIRLYVRRTRIERRIDIRVILKNREPRINLRNELADAIWMVLGRLRTKRGINYDFFVDASSPRWIGVDCPLDQYTRKRVIEVVRKLAEKHDLRVGMRP